MSALSEIKEKVERQLLAKNFISCQIQAYKYLKRFKERYPQILLKMLNMTYEFKAFLERSNQTAKEVPPYNELDPNQEEEMFYTWEQLYGICHLQDWMEPSQVFMRQIKRVFTDLVEA